MTDGRVKINTTKWDDDIQRCKEVCTVCLQYLYHINTSAALVHENLYFSSSAIYKHVLSFAVVATTFIPHQNNIIPICILCNSSFYMMQMKVGITF